MSTTTTQDPKPPAALQQIEDRMTADMERLKRMAADLEAQTASTLMNYLSAKRACLDRYQSTFAQNGKNFSCEVHFAS